MIKMMDKIALWILVIGGLNWGLVGIFSFDLIAWAFGSGTWISRILYVLVFLSAAWCISLIFRKNEVLGNTIEAREARY